MNMKKTFLQLLYIGFSLGFFLGVILTAMIVTLVADDGTLHLYTTEFEHAIHNPLAAFIIHSMTCGILGMITLGAASIYEINEWDLLKATIVHFLVIVCSFYLAAFFLRWFSYTNTKAICISLAMFIINYTVIWLGQYLSCKAQIKEINQKLILKKKSQQNV